MGSTSYAAWRGTVFAGITPDAGKGIESAT